MFNKYKKSNKPSKSKRHNRSKKNKINNLADIVIYYWMCPLVILCLVFSFFLYFDFFFGPGDLAFVKDPDTESINSF